MYELGEKSNKYFLNLEKNRACQNILRKICSETQEITALTKLNSTTFDYYANLFKEKLETNSESFNHFLKDFLFHLYQKLKNKFFEEDINGKGYL